MVIEHVFVTTLDAPQALTAASNFLSQRGFVAINHSAMSMDNSWKTLEMTRGRKNAARAKSISELPQSIRVDFDRGRVTVAASIAANAAWGGGRFTNVGFGLDSTSSNYSPARMKLHTDLLTAIARGLESVLSTNQHPNLAALEWANIEAIIAEAAQKRRRNQYILLAVVFVLIAAAITIAVIAATHRW